MDQQRLGVNHKEAFIKAVKEGMLVLTVTMDITELNGKQG